MVSHISLGRGCNGGVRLGRCFDPTIHFVKDFVSDFNSPSVNVAQVLAVLLHASTLITVRFLAMLGAGFITPVSVTKLPTMGTLATFIGEVTFNLAF